MPGPGALTKAGLRADVLARRAARSGAERAVAAADLARRVLALPELATADTVAAYVAGPGEPETRPLLDALLDRGTTVLLPLLLPDFDLDWAEYAGPDALRAGRFGILEPVGPARGRAAVAAAAVLLCPGVAGDPAGHRLGRGGGSYDRVLARLDATGLRCLLLYDDEVIDAVPVDAHDQPVDVIVTPARTLRASPGRR